MQETRRPHRAWRRIARSAGSASTLVLLAATSCARNSGGQTAPRAVADTSRHIGAVYAAVLDEIFPRGANAPQLVVIQQTTEPSVVDLDYSAKPKRVIPAVIRPFKYPVPIAFVDTLGRRELNIQSFKADSAAYTLPVTDARYYQRGLWPYVQRFPGAWGIVTFGRVGISRDSASAVVVAEYSAFVPLGFTAREMFRFRRANGEWTVVDRIPDTGVIVAEAIPYAMLHASVDSTQLPHPRRKRIRGTVRDSASGKTLASVALSIQSVPLDKRGRMLESGGVLHWADLQTDAVGRFVVNTPPSGWAIVSALCPRGRNQDAAVLDHGVLLAESALDTVLDLRVHLASCPRLSQAIAEEEERHRQRVAQAKIDAAARAIAVTISGTVFDVLSGRPVPRAQLRVGRRPAGSTDSLGRYSLSGVAPGKTEISVTCPVQRQWFGRTAATATVHARPATRETLDFRIDMKRCADVPIDTVNIRTSGVWSIGFEDGFFTPCKRFDQIPIGGYLDWSGQALLVFADEKIEPPGGWPDIKPVDGYVKVFLTADAQLIGPGSYGHMGIASYLLRVTRIRRAESPSRRSCASPDP